MYDVAIVGAGVIGGMLARELTKYKLSVCVLEKENDVAMGASKANSGIIHGGYDPVPETLKAKMNTDGVELLYEAAKELNVPYNNNGSIVVAFGETEEPVIDELYNRGIKNKISGMKVISGDEARQIEPNLSNEVTKALLVTNSGIICPYALTIAAVGNAMDNGAKLITNFCVKHIKKVGDEFRVCSDDGRQIVTKYLVNCAGAFSDKIADMLDDKFFEIIPRAGEYLLLDKSEGKTASHTIFQAPTDNGKGILVTPTADGNLLIGPTAVKVETNNGTETTADGLNNVQMLAKKSVPSINTRAVITAFSGVRASEKNGDFIIKPSDKVENFVHVAAIDSPGLTSCVSIARYTVNILKKIGLSLVINDKFCGNRADTHAFRKMNDREKDEYIKKHPAYGRIVCRCEGISEGEIVEVLHQNPVPSDVDGVKRRTRSGMGRCQGGFCAPYVMKLIARENNTDMQNITKKGDGSDMVVGRF